MKFKKVDFELHFGHFLSIIFNFAKHIYGDIGYGEIGDIGTYRYLPVDFEGENQSALVNGFHHLQNLRVVRVDNRRSRTPITRGRIEFIVSLGPIPISLDRWINLSIKLSIQLSIYPSLRTN